MKTNQQQPFVLRLLLLLESRPGIEFCKDVNVTVRITDSEAMEVLRFLDEAAEVEKATPTRIIPRVGIERAMDRDGDE